MDPLQLSAALSGIDEKYVASADPELQPARAGSGKRRILRFAAPVAALVALAIILHAALGGGPAARAYELEMAQYPEMPSWAAIDPEHGTEEELALFYEENRQYEARVEPMRGAGQGLEDFFTDAGAAVLSGAGTENRVFSPLNTYLALAMLAELTDGGSRAQILSLLGQDSIGSLRTQANHIWNANYCDNGVSKCIPAASLWLNEGFSFEQAPLRSLAENYYASSFWGDFASKDYVNSMRQWINGASEGLLEEQTANLTLEPDDAMILLSTLYFGAGWMDEFDKAYSFRGVFHGAAGDTDAEYMARVDDSGWYSYGERFGAVSRSLADGSRMWFILPDEGVSVQELLADAEYRRFAAYMQTSGQRWSTEWEQTQSARIDLLVPKFEVSADLDLTQTLRSMGVTDCFDPERADFSPLSPNEGLWAGSVNHGARLIVDEEGVRAASYMKLPLCMKGAPAEETIQFHLDRPFLFLLVSPDGIPLYTGVVNQI